ncbi:MAG: hypothetical protein QXZ44_02010 [Ferroplasma sp.]
MHYIIYLRRPEKYYVIKPTLCDPDKLSYYKMEGKPLLAIGSLDLKIDKRHTAIANNLDSHAREDYIDNSLEKPIDRLPGMLYAHIILTRVGIYDMPPDGYNRFTRINRLRSPICLHRIERPWI